jgi:hypothetical protein
MLPSPPPPPLPTRLASRTGRASAALVVGVCVLFGPSQVVRAQTEDGEVQGADATEDPDSYADTDPSALTDFHDALDPHGSWYDDPAYGTSWVPNPDEVGPNFAPYVTDGSWAYDDDYVWQSNYDWGWVAFHYGRWAWMSGRWGWVPGRSYAGAWVTWRVGPSGFGYVGWGPMAPSFGWKGGAAYGLGPAVRSQPAPVAFVAREAMFAPRVGAYVVPGDRVGAIASATHPYVRAEPVPSNQPLAQGVMHGPTPKALGISAGAIVRVDPGNRSARRALAYSRPSTAVPLGARPSARAAWTRAETNRGGAAFGAQPHMTRAGMGRAGRL